MELLPVEGAHATGAGDHESGKLNPSGLCWSGAGELGEEVLVDAAEGVLGAVGGSPERDVAHEVDELAEALLVETGQTSQEARAFSVVPSRAIIASSSRRWSVASRPVMAGPISLAPFATARLTPIPRKRPGSPSSHSKTS
jgi:hypothetical protein